MYVSYINSLIHYISMHSCILLRGNTFDSLNPGSSIYLNYLVSGSRYVATKITTTANNNIILTVYVDTVINFLIFTHQKIVKNVIHNPLSNYQKISVQIAVYINLEDFKIFFKKTSYSSRSPD